MRVDGSANNLQCVSEDFSKMKLTNPFLNDLSTTTMMNGREERTSTSVSENSRNPKKPSLYEQDDEGDTYLHAAIAQRHPEIALALIRGAPNPNYLDTVNDEGFTPLHLAVVTEQWRIVRWLIVAGAKPSTRNFNGETPLHLAARFGSVSCCKAITEPVQNEEKMFLNNPNYQVTAYRPIDLDQWDNEGQTCIHIAASHGHIDVLRLLIFYGANINAREGKSGYTALHFAVENRDERMAHFLMNECEKLDTYVTTYGGRSPLQLGHPVDVELRNAFLSRGMISPYPSDDEDDIHVQSDSEDEEIQMPSSNCMSSSLYLPQLVNSCV